MDYDEAQGYEARDRAVAALLCAGCILLAAITADVALNGRIATYFGGHPADDQLPVKETTS